jgi:ribose transport system permease protein
MNLYRLLGIFAVLVGLYAMLLSADPTASNKGNLYDVANRQGFNGILTLGAALLILSGGIDLSMGSVVGFGAVLFAYLMKEGVHPYASVAVVVAAGALIGLANGLLVTKLKLQAFLVTLCGMFIYRGLARSLGSDVGNSIGLTGIREKQPDFAPGIETLRAVFIGKNSEGAIAFPAEFCWMLGLVAIVGFFLHFTAYGRFWYAIGRNELAAKFAGVRVDRQRIAGYVICSMLSMFAGVLLLLNYSTLRSDNAGQGDELEAITGAVLGGCSMRGGEGTALGIVMGAMVMPLLKNIINFYGIKSDVIPAIIGLTLLFGTLVDEAIRRWFRKR